LKRAVLCALLALIFSAHADAQSSNPWTLGIVDASFIWTPPSGVAASIPDCALRLAKQSGYTAATARQGEESPLQHCLLQKMHEHGATKNAIEFTKWYYATPYGDSAYITALAKPQYGPVQLASIFYPGNVNNKAAYLFVNGTHPRVADPNVVFAPEGEPWKHNPNYQAILTAHPNAVVYHSLSFVSLARRDGGGQRFTLAAAILDGCHSCARLGTVDIVYDFGNLGAPKGLAVSAVRQGP